MGIFADVLFTKTQQRVLAVLYGQPYRSFYANEIISLAGGGSGAVQRELASLAESGLVHAWRAGNQKHYQVNHEAAIFEELRGIVVKTFGAAEVLRAALLPVLDQVQAAFIHGAAVTGTVHADGGIELVAVAPAELHEQLRAMVAPLSDLVARAIHPACYSAEEFARQWRENAGPGASLRAVLDQAKIFIKGNEADLVKLAAP